jgi:hypothetical protein
MQETTHQIEAVHPQPPAHHSSPTPPPYQTIGYKDAITAGPRGNNVRYPTGGAEGKRHTFRFTLGAFQMFDVWCLVSDGPMNFLLEGGDD